MANTRVEVKEGGVVLVTVSRPKALNALNAATIEELQQIFDDIRDNHGVRAVVLTGDGKAFVAGADISEMADMDPTLAEAFSRRGQALFASIEALRVPVIAAINGYALGGGCELAMACDVLYASEKARFGQPEVNLGVIPGFGGTQRLTRLVGRAKASELIFTGRLINAQEALRIGLVCQIFSPEALLEGALKTADEIASKGPLAITAAKRVILAGADVPLERACDREAAAFGYCFSTSDQTEGMAAFLEKRPANFKGF